MKNGYALVRVVFGVRSKMINYTRIKQAILGFIEKEIEARKTKKEAQKYLDEITETYKVFEMYVYNEVWVGLEMNKLPKFVMETLVSVMEEKDIVEEVWDDVMWLCHEQEYYRDSDEEKDD